MKRQKKRGKTSNRFEVAFRLLVQASDHGLGSSLRPFGPFRLVIPLGFPELQVQKRDASKPSSGSPEIVSSRLVGFQVDEGLFVDRRVPSVVREFPVKEDDRLFGHCFHRLRRNRKARELL